jgi:integrase
LFEGKPRDNGAPGPLRPTSRSWARLLRAAGLIPPKPTAEPTGGRNAKKPKREKKGGWERHPFCFHDLRRTVRDMLTRELGVAQPIAEAVLGHVGARIVRTYAPSGIPLKEKRRALERWEARLIRILELAPRSGGSGPLDL